MTPTRRQLLSVVAGTLPLVSGCFFGDTHDDSELAIHFEPVRASELGAEYLHTSEEWTPAQRTFLDVGVRNATVAYGHRPFESVSVIRANGTYYAVSVAENGTETVRRPVLRAEPVSEPTEEVGDFSGLARADGLALRCALVSAQRDGPGPCVLNAGNRSAFWPDLRFTHVEHSGDYYRLTSAEETVELARYDYVFEPVARDRSVFADYAARSMLVVDYADQSLSPEERSILETAAADGVYRESPPYSDALRTLVDGLDSRANRHRVYVRFEGSYYLARTTRAFDD